MSSTAHPTVVIGAGPTGLAAAAHLRARGREAVVVEAGDRAGAHVRQWGHVRLFSPWAELVDPTAVELLAATTWQPPDPTAYPTGQQWAQAYLQPLADALVGVGVEIRYRTRVTGVARRGRDLVVDAGRGDGDPHEPFTVHVSTATGEKRLGADAVMDASGTWATPNPLGADGLPALGETTAHAEGRIVYAVPDLAHPTVAAQYAGKHVVVAGTGASAHTTLVGLGRLAEQHPNTRITWLVRRARVGDAFGGGEADQLERRGALGEAAHAVVDGPHATTVTGFRTAEVHHESTTDSTGDSVDSHPTGRLRLVDEAGARVDHVDRIVAVTGQRPDHSTLSEVRMDLDPSLQAPVKLAPLIDPNIHSCGTVYPHGAAELTHPEPGLFIVGAKAYGRAPTFLALTGYEQVRSVVALLDGDHDAAARIELILPETGVCGGAGSFGTVASTSSTSAAVAGAGAGAGEEPCCS